MSTTVDIQNFKDANDAGGCRSSECTLILTEGNSAKELVVYGISYIPQNLYAVYPCKGKFLNVRDASEQDISVNTQITDIKMILGLKDGMCYDKDSVKQLRYGCLVLMTDQDADGAHIKGLILNFFHKFWPSLLTLGFVQMVATPLVKVTLRNKGNVEYFYSRLEFQEWEEKTGADVNLWHIKHYKGLGSHYGEEGKAYFLDFENKKKAFVCLDETDDEAFVKAFDKEKTEERRAWIKQKEDSSYLNYTTPGKIRCHDFINKEVKQYTIEHLRRSIPSVVDGLKPAQRRVLYTAFRQKLVNEKCVSEFAGCVAKECHIHDDKPLCNTIISMAQNFVGSNNVNLLMPNGQFGTRVGGGNNCAEARYIFTELANVTRYIFIKDDDRLLKGLKEFGKKVEPAWFVPIIPMVLVNGSFGIGTGWSTQIPKYNPIDVIANIKHLIHKQNLTSMVPWYKGFKGTITKREKSSTNYISTGLIEEVKVDKTIVKLCITELPLKMSTQDYIKILTEMRTNDFIKEFINNCTAETINFDVTLTKEQYGQASKVGLEKKFKLTSRLSTSNMHVFDKDGKNVVLHAGPEQIMREFYKVRLLYYYKRKERLVKKYEKKFKALNARMKLFEKASKKAPTEANCDSLLPNNLVTRRSKLEEQIADMKKLCPKSLWLEELNKLEKVILAEDTAKNAAEEANTTSKGGESQPTACSNEEEHLEGGG